MPIQEKIVFIGDEQGGKSSIINRIRTRDFDNNIRATIGVDFYLDEREEVKLHIWDTSGADRFNPLRRMYARGAGTFVYCIDLTKELNKDTQNSVIASMKQDHPQAEIILVGTKSDIADLKTSPEALREFAQDNGLPEPFITSAKENTNISELHDELYRIALRNLWEKTLAKLPTGSSLHTSLLQLKDSVRSLPQAEEIENQAAALVFALIRPIDINEKQTAIIEFQTACEALITPTSSGKIALKAIAVVAVTALVTLIAALIGFGIGFAAGLWIGPGAFISAVLGGTSSGLAVVAGSATLGLSAGALSTYSLFKPAPEIGAIVDVTTAAHQYIAP